MLKTKAASVWNSTVLRSARERIAMSDVWNVMPSVKAK